MYFSVYMYMAHGPCGFFGCMLSLHCCTGDSLVTVSGGCSPVVHWLLIVEASPVEEHGLWSTQASVVVASGLQSTGLIVVAYQLRSLIHFEFILVYGVRECSNFVLLHVAVQFSQHHLLKRLSSILCHRLGDHMCVGLSVGFLSCCIGLYFSFCASAILSQ